MSETTPAGQDAELEARDAIVVKCLGVPDSQIRDLGQRRILHGMYGRGDYQKTVTIFNPKVNRWETYPLADYYDKCPVDGKLMRVYAVIGSTWLACCSRMCYERYLLAEKWIKTGCQICGMLPGGALTEKHVYSHTDEEFSVRRLIGGV